MHYLNHPLRHELKYRISYADYVELRSRALSFMKHDTHGSDGKYFIRSMYLDDIYFSNYNEKSDGVSRRRKYRIRIYDLSRDVIKFEIKDKFDSYISKSSSVITYDQCRSLLRGDFGFVGDMIRLRPRGLHLRRGQCAHDLRYEPARRTGQRRSV